MPARPPPRTICEFSGGAWTRSRSPLEAGVQTTLSGLGELASPGHWVAGWLLPRRYLFLPALLQLSLVGGDQLFGRAEGRVAPDEREVVVAVLEQVGLRIADRL